MDDYPSFRDPTAARYYDEDPAYLDALSAPAQTFAGYSHSSNADSNHADTNYADSSGAVLSGADWSYVGYSGVRSSGAAKPQAAQPQAAQPQAAQPQSAQPQAPGIDPAAAPRVAPTAPRAVPRPAAGTLRSSRPTGWDRAPAPALAEPVRGWASPSPGNRRRPGSAAARSVQTNTDAPTYSGDVPTYSGTPTDFPARPRFSAAKVGSRSAGAPDAAFGRAGKPNRLKWLPGLIVVLVVLFLSNGGSTFVKDRVDNIRQEAERRSVPTAATQAVAGYYDAIAANNVAAASEFICAGRKRAWLAGQTSPSSDTKRGIRSHRITDKRKSDSAYDFDVSLTIAPSATAAPVATKVIVRVVQEAGQYRLCQGTNP